MSECMYAILNEHYELVVIVGWIKEEGKETPPLSDFVQDFQAIHHRIPIVVALLGIQIMASFYHSVVFSFLFKIMAQKTTEKSR